MFEILGQDGPVRWWMGILVVACGLGVWILSAHEPRQRAPRASTPLKHVAEPVRHPAYPPPVDLTAVDRERDLHGVVVRAADGEPVPGAALRVLHYARRALSLANEWGEERPAEGPTTISAADGSFSIPLGTDARCDLEARAEGYAPYVAAMCQAGGRVRIELAEPVSVSLTVLTAEGAAVEGAIIRMNRHFNGESPMLDVGGLSDAQGRVVLRDLPAGIDVSLDVEHPLHGSKRWYKNFALPASGTHEQEVRFDAGRRIHGRVTDAVTDAPIAGARVGTGRYWSPYFAVTDDDGRYVLAGWTFSERTTLQVSAAGYGVDGAALGPKDQIDFQLRRGFSIRGVVVDADGQPIGGVRVAALGRGYARTRRATGLVQVLSVGSGTTEEDGEFVIGGLRHGTRHSIVIAASGYGRVLYEFLPPLLGGAADGDLGRIELAPARTIRGRMTRGGQPMANRFLQLIGANEDRERMLGGKRAHGAFDGNYLNGRTDDLGRFSFGDLAEGTYVVRYREPGTPHAEQTIEVGDEDVEVLFEAPDGPLLPVDVVNEEGEPMEGVTLWVELQEGPTVIRTDASGRAHVRMTSQPKSVHARPKSAEYLKQLVELRGNEQELKIVLKRGLAIRGVVVTEAGEPISLPVLEAQRGGQKVGSTRGDPKGEFTLYVPAGGTCRLKFVGEGTPSGGYSSGRWNGSLDGVAPGGEPVRLVVSSPTRNASLTVRVLLPDGSPVKGAEIAIFGPTDDNGERKLTGLPARPMHLWVKWETTEYARPKMQKVVPDGQVVEIRFRNANPITGRLLRDGKPVANASVSIQRDRENLAGAQTNSQGQFRLLVAAEESGPFKIDVSEPGRPRLQLREVAAGSKNLTVRCEQLAAR